MEQKHQNWIQKNFINILKHTNLELLLEHVKRKKIFPDTLLEKYQLQAITPHARKRQFYWDIQKRGPQAYELLLEACQESGQYELYSILKPKFLIPVNSANILEDKVYKHAIPYEHSLLQNKDNTATIKTMEENPETATLCLNMEPSKIVVKLSEERMDIPNCLQHKSLTPYVMHGPKRGVVFVINNIEFMHDRHKKRNGAEVDAKNLKELFRQLGFLWYYWENQTRMDTVTKLREFTNNKLLNEVDSCFVIFMSHGEEGHSPEDTRIITYDNLYYNTSEIIHKFSNSNCKLLRGKPKVILFQVCRGEMEDFGVKPTSASKAIRRDNTIKFDNTITTEFDGESDETMAIISDMLICYTSIPGYRTYRDKFLGAWFIQHFCEVFMKYSYNKDVYTLFQMISSEVAEERTKNDARQSAYIGTFSFRPCFLNPGLYAISK